MIEIRPTLTVMIGIPFSGKSTLRNWMVRNANPDHVRVLSTDDTITQWGKERGTDYRGAYANYISPASDLFFADLKWFASRTPHIIVDRTNILKSARDSIVTTVRSISPNTIIRFVTIEPRLDESLARNDKDGQQKLSATTIIEKFREYEPVTDAEDWDEHYTFDINGLAVDMKTKNRI